MRMGGRADADDEQSIALTLYNTVDRECPDIRLSSARIATLAQNIVGRQANWAGVAGLPQCPVGYEPQPKAALWWAQKVSSIVYPPESRRFQLVKDQSDLRLQNLGKLFLAIFDGQANLMPTESFLQIQLNLAQTTLPQICHPNFYRRQEAPGEYDAAWSALGGEPPHLPGPILFARMPRPNVHLFNNYLKEDWTADFERTWKHNAQYVVSEAYHAAIEKRDYWPERVAGAMMDFVYKYDSFLHRPTARLEEFLSNCEEIAQGGSPERHFFFTDTWWLNQLSRARQRPRLTVEPRGGMQEDEGLPAQFPIRPYPWSPFQSYHATGLRSLAEREVQAKNSQIVLSMVTRIMDNPSLVLAEEKYQQAAYRLQQFFERHIPYRAHGTNFYYNQVRLLENNLNPSIRYLSWYPTSPVMHDSAEERALQATQAEYKTCLDLARNPDVWVRTEWRYTDMLAPLGLAPNKQTTRAPLHSRFMAMESGASMAPWFDLAYVQQSSYACRFTDHRAAQRMMMRTFHLQNSKSYWRMSPVFDPKWYLAHHRDVLQSIGPDFFAPQTGFCGATNHFMRHGMEELRLGSDLAKSMYKFRPEMHYYGSGWYAQFLIENSKQPGRNTFSVTLGLTLPEEPETILAYTMAEEGESDFFAMHSRVTASGFVEIERVPHPDSSHQGLTRIQTCLPTAEAWHFVTGWTQGGDAGLKPDIVAIDRRVGVEGNTLWVRIISNDTDHAERSRILHIWGRSWGRPRVGMSFHTPYPPRGAPCLQYLPMIPPHKPFQRLMLHLTA